MTDNTQELRELVEKAIQRAYYLGQEYCRLADSESWSDNRRSFDTQDKFDALRSETVSVAGAKVAALLDEIDSLRAELQARQWVSVEDRLPEIDYTKPRHGWRVPVIACWGGSSNNVAEMAYTANGYAKTERGRKPRFEWQGRISPWNVTHWQPLPLPPAPPQGESA